MASQSLVAFLAEAGAKVEPLSNGETELASQIAGDSVQSEETASCPPSSDASLAFTSPNDNATEPPDVTRTSDAHIHASHTAPPEEEAQKCEAAMESMDTVKNIEKPLSPDSAMLSTIPSTAAIITDCIEADSAPSIAAVAVSDASEAITIPSTESVPTVVDMIPSTESVPTVVDTMPSTEAVIIDAITVDSSAAASGPPTEAVTADSTHGVDCIAVATTDSTVVDATDTTAPLTTDSTAPLAMDSAEPITTVSTTIEPILSSPASSLQVSSPPCSKPGLDPPSEELNRSAAKPEEEFPPELESFQIPAHWHPKPCVHISSIGGALTEEELLPVFSKFGPIASVSYENERHDAVLIRYELYLESGEELLAQVREATNSTKLGDKTLIVEPFRPDSLLFVGNLTPGIDDAALQAMFEPHGKIERAFVLHNAEGQSKCYGFVEYSLKSQAMTAKAVMGNINMDGRVLRVEWSDCKRVEDMFSTVLFIDRIPREGPHVEGALKSLFGKYGKIRDSHLAIGTGNQIRGFAFIDFYHSASADKAHQALDGHAFEGSSIRVSFANPSKSAQSYRFRYGAQAGQGSNGRGGGTGGTGTLLGTPPRGLTRGPSPRVPTPMPLLPSRFMSPARPGMLGFGIGMQFGRGSFDRGPVSSFHGGGRGMLGPSSFGAGRASLMMPRAGMAVVENSMQKLPFGQGPVTITPSAIVQVATAQARAREEEAKARAEAAKHGVARSYSSNDSLSMNHYQRLQQLQHQNYLQQQQASSYEQQYKQQGDMYMHQQAHQASLQPQQQAWSQVQQQHSQQNMQLQRTQYHANASQNYPQQHQGTQNDAYYQQAAQQHSQQHAYASQYGQQQGYQYGQQAAQMYGQAAQQTGEQYQQSAQQAQAAAYPQQNYGEQYAAQQQASQQGYYPTASYDGSAGMDAAQQQAYSAYYQQQAQAQAQAQTQAVANPEAAASATPAATQQSYEAQWAAYYASQAAYQQQTAATDVGQKRSADQMETAAQNQAAYNYAGYPQQGGVAYQQQQAQPSTENAATYQVQANSAAAYQQQAAYAATAYQQQGYQQAAAPAVYGQTGYEQASAPAADGGYQQQAAAAVQGQAAAYDYSKRPRF